MAVECDALGLAVRNPVGASLLAKVVNDNAVLLVARGVFAFFASKLASTREVIADSPV